MTLPSAPADNRFRILLIEDDDVTAHNLLTLLEGSGFVCRHSPDPDFVGWVEADPHLVVLEYQSPIIDALAVCREVREGLTGAGTGIPIIMLGPSDDACEVNALKSGADDYMAAPLRPSVVMARVVAHLRRAYRYNEVSDASGRTKPAPSETLSAASPLSAKAPAASAGPPSAMPAFIGDIPLWQDDDEDELPSGWAECTLCGHRGPSEDFETDDLMGRHKVECPNPKCRSAEHVMFSLD